MPIYSSASSQYAITALPQAVYDAVANPLVTSYTVARGRYTLPEYFTITRSNLDLDWNGSTLVLSPIGYVFRVLSTVDNFVDPLSPTRHASHLTGTITAATTQLTMDADEIMDLVPGEIVQIIAGVNTSDPVEPFKFIIAEVLSVAGQTITFTAPLGQDIAVYANEDALRAATAEFLWPKIGPWGEDYLGANYKKGLGTDHGLIRYVGGMTHDVTFRNFHLEITLPPDADLTVGTYEFFFIDVLRPKILNWTATNFVSSLVHTWRCDDVLIDGLTVRGEARSRISIASTMTGQVMSAWGGTRITYQNIDIDGVNMTLANTEVSPADILFKNLKYKANFVRAGHWTYSSLASVLQFYGTTLGFGVRIEDSSLDISGLSADWDFDPGNIITFKNLVIPGTGLDDFFFFDRHIIEGTITVSGIVYGPAATDTETIVRTSGSGKKIFAPKGFYRSLRLRVTDQGSATDLNDGYGNSYLAALSNGQWTDVVTTWFRPGASTFATYFAKQYFTFQFTGGVSCTIEFELEYLPAPDDAGWSMN